MMRLSIVCWRIGYRHHLVAMMYIRGLSAHEPVVGGALSMDHTDTSVLPLPLLRVLQAARYAIGVTIFWFIK